MINSKQNIIEPKPVLLLFFLLSRCVKINEFQNHSVEEEQLVHDVNEYFWVSYDEARCGIDTTAMKYSYATILYT